MKEPYAIAFMDGRQYILRIVRYDMKRDVVRSHSMGRFAEDVEVGAIEVTMHGQLVETVTDASAFQAALTLLETP